MQSHDTWLMDTGPEGPEVEDCPHVCTCCRRAFTHESLVEQDYDDAGHTEWVEANCADYQRCESCRRRGQPSIIEMARQAWAALRGER